MSNSENSETPNIQEREARLLALILLYISTELLLGVIIMILNEEEFYNYRTDPVNGSDVVDMNRTGVSFYDDFLSKDPDIINGLKNYKNLVGKVVMMSPNEYYQECSNYGFPDHKPSVESLKRSRRSHVEVLNHLKNVLTVYKHKFPMPFINKSDNGQEGLHRMMVIGDMFGWDHKVPVLVVDWYDKQKAYEQAKQERKQRVEYNIEKSIKEALRYRFRNLEELQDQLQWELDKQFDYNNDDIDVPVVFELTNNDKDKTFVVSIGPYSSEFDYDDVSFIDHDENDSIDNDLDDVDLEDFMQRYFGDNWEKDFSSTYDKLKNSIKEDMSSVEVDSDGNSLTQEQSNFFKDSKVRDTQGNLLVCYHGSAEVFDTFDKTKIRRGNSLGRGFYFSSDPNTSENYKRNGGEVKKVYLNIKNPRFFTITSSHQQFLIEIALEFNIPPFDKNKRPVNLNNAVTKVLQAHGYDGVISYIPSEKKYEIVTYEPEQAKSVANNAPTSKANINEESN